MYELARNSVMGANSALAVRVHTPLGWFGSVREAARAHDCASATVSRKAKSDRFFHKEYYYETPEENTTIRQSGKHRSVAVFTPDGKFESVRSAAAYYKVYHSTISKWCKNKPNEFYLENNENCHIVQSTRRRVHTPLGWFDSVNKAAVAMGVGSAGTISTRCKAKWPEYYYSE
jgi:hypothetical protein